MLQWGACRRLRWYDWLSRSHGGYGLWGGKDETRPELIGDVRPGPLEQDQRAALEASEIEDGHRQPGEPAHVAVQLHAAYVGDGVATPHRGEHALADVREWTRRYAAIEAGTKELCGILALLHRDHRHTRPHVRRLAYPRALTPDEDVRIPLP